MTEHTGRLSDSERSWRGGGEGLDGCWIPPTATWMPCELSKPREVAALNGLPHAAHSFKVARRLTLPSNFFYGEFQQTLEALGSLFYKLNQVSSIRC